MVYCFFFLENASNEIYFPLEMYLFQLREKRLLNSTERLNTPQRLAKTFSRKLNNL